MNYPQSLHHPPEGSPMLSTHLNSGKADFITDFLSQKSPLILPAVL